MVRLSCQLPDLLFWNKPVHPYKVLHVNQSVSTDRFLVSLARLFKLFLVKHIHEQIKSIERGREF